MAEFDKTHYQLGLGITRYMRKIRQEIQYFYLKVRYEGPQIRYQIRQFRLIIFINIKAKVKNPRRMCREGMNVKLMEKIAFSIFPFQIFGSLQNFRKFALLIRKLCTASCYDNMKYELLIEGWRLSDIEWLRNEREEKKERVLLLVVIWLLNIFKTYVLRRIFFIQSSLRSYKLCYYPSSAYQKFHGKAVQKMINKKQLLRNRTERKSKTYLHLYPKKNMTSERPIVRTKLLGDICRSKRRHINTILHKKGLAFSNKDLFIEWSKFVEVSRGKEIYGIKMDLKDAFSNVNIERIIYLIKDGLMEEEPGICKAICNSLENQSVKVFRKDYIWKRGLMQGMPFSSTLCEVSRTNFDKLYLYDFINEGNFFFRQVDDYFFCSLNKEEVIRFKDTLEKYCVISKEKTQSNLDGIHNKITFNGRIFNLQTKEVEIKVETMKSYRYKTKYCSTNSDDSAPNEFLFEVGRMGRNSFYFNNILMNQILNSKKTMLNNYFKAMIIIATKIDYAVRSGSKKVPKDLYTYSLERIMKYYANKIRSKLIKQKQKKDEPLGIERSVFERIGIRAFLLVFKIRAEVYKNTIRKLEKYLMKKRRRPHLCIEKSIARSMPKDFIEATD